MKFHHSLSALALIFVAACSQGSDIVSPGPSSAGTPPGGGGSGGGTGGGGGGGTAACPAGFTQGAAVGGLTTCNLSGVYLANVTLQDIDGIAYRLSGRVDIGTDTGPDGNRAGGQAATLTIEPGVTLFGESGADYLVVNRGSQIIADGERDAPIVMTSANDITRRAANPNDTGGSAISEWGGLVILGQAPTNNCRDAATPGSAQCENIVEGVTNPEAVYGGADTNDNSGILRYLQVRFAGFAINTQGNELNGITLGGVGNGTTLEYIQVHNNSDDGIEFFGGTANARYVVLTGNDDDSLDTDNGWNGSIQYLLIKQREDGGDNIVEASSAGGVGVAPLSNGKVSNFTFVGNRSNAFRLNTGTVGQYSNGVVNYGKQCFRWESSAGDATAGYNAAADPTFKSVLFNCDGGLTTSNSDTPTATAAVAADPNNTTTQPDSLASEFFPGPNELSITPFDATTLSSFFLPTTYIGAFGPTETTTANWATGWTFNVFPAPACPAGTIDSGFDLQGQNVCDLTGIIQTNVRLTRGNFYRLQGRIDVGIDVGADGNAPGGVPAELTIESGVTVFGNDGSDYVVVNRGSKLFSNGTRENPVIFTSEADVGGTQTDPANSISEWGGLVLLGRAPTNNCRDAAAPGTVDCENIVEGVTNPEAVYGGALVDDSSGSIRFTQVRFAGFAINTQGNELNGITLGGVGNGTTLEYIQVHNNSDDGIEFFGGTANARYVVLTGNDDDSLDTDNGWNGSIQFLIVRQRENGGDNIVEASSAGGVGVAPLSDGKVSNFTFIGNRSNAFRLNTGTVGKYYNGVVSYGKQCFRWEASAGNANTTYEAAADPSFNSVLFDCELGLTTSNSVADVPAAAIAAGTNNSTTIADTLNGFVNGAAESGVTAFDVTTVNPFFESVDYIGAVKDANDTWWQGWSCGLDASTPC